MYNKNFVWFMAAVAATGGLLFGFDTGVISGAIPFMKLDFKLDDSQVENITTLGLIGAVVGALVSGWVSDKAGRKNVILVSAIVFLTGALWCGFATSIASLLASPFLFRTCYRHRLICHTFVYSRNLTCKNQGYACFHVSATDYCRIACCLSER
jgi:MFS family permease